MNNKSTIKAIQAFPQEQVAKKEAYGANGKPLSLKAFIKRIEKAEAEVKSGKYVTISQLEKESEKW